MYAETRIPLTAWWIAGLAAVGLHVLLLQAWLPATLFPHGEPAGGRGAVSRLRIELGGARVLPAATAPAPAQRPAVSLPAPTPVAERVPSEAPRLEKRLSSLPNVAAAPPASGTGVAAETRESLANARVQASGTAGREEFETLGRGSGTFRNDYFEALHARVISARDYPRRARLDGVEGTVVLGIQIDRNGQIQSSQVRESSGSRALDRHAARIAKRAAPFGPVPSHFQEADLRFELPVQFSLTD